MKKAVTIFFLFIICIQCLPVKELGKCLFDSSFVEEETCKKELDKKDFSFRDHLIIDISLLLPAEDPEHILKLSAALLPAPLADVTTPPPNVFA